jgi:hypothetical protein
VIWPFVIRPFEFRPFVVNPKIHRRRRAISGSTFPLPFPPTGKFKRVEIQVKMLAEKKENQK